MVDKIRPRKAAGSGDAFGSRNAGGRPHRQNEPQAAPRGFAYGNIVDEYDSYEYDRQSRAVTSTTPRILELPQESSVDLEQLQEAQAEHLHHQVRERSSTKTEHDTDTDDGDHGMKDESSDSSEDWEELARDTTEGEAGALTTRGPSPTPSYDFPGTWPAAAKDTAFALTQLTSATKSYASAIASSGLGKASWSIGTAALSSTNKYALSFAGWGMAKTGFMPSDLPAPFKKWVLSKEEADRKKKALEGRKRRQRLIAGETVPVLFKEGDGRETFMLDLHQTTREGEFVGSMPKSVIESLEKERGWEEQKMSVQQGGSQLGDYDGSEEEEGKGDGLIRVFEFDDE